MFDFFDTKFDHPSYSNFFYKISLLLSWLALLIEVLQEWLKFDYVCTNFLNKISGSKTSYNLGWREYVARVCNVSPPFLPFSKELHAANGQTEGSLGGERTAWLVCMYVHGPAVWWCRAGCSDRKLWSEWGRGPGRSALDEPACQCQGVDILLRACCRVLFVTLMHANAMEEAVMDSGITCSIGWVSVSAHAQLLHGQPRPSCRFPTQWRLLGPATCAKASDCVSKLFLLLPCPALSAFWTVCLLSLA
jgi:hypothetical protein